MKENKKRTMIERIMKRQMEKFERRVKRQVKIIIKESETSS